MPFSVRNSSGDSSVSKTRRRLHRNGEDASPRYPITQPCSARHFHTLGRGLGSRHLLRQAMHGLRESRTSIVPRTSASAPSHARVTPASPLDRGADPALLCPRRETSPWRKPGIAQRGKCASRRRPRWRGSQRAARCSQPAHSEAAGRSARMPARVRMRVLSSGCRWLSRVCGRARLGVNQCADPLYP